MSLNIPQQRRELRLSIEAFDRAPKIENITPAPVAKFMPKVRLSPCSSTTRLCAPLPLISLTITSGHEQHQREEGAGEYQATRSCADAAPTPRERLQRNNLRRCPFSGVTALFFWGSLVALNGFQLDNAVHPLQGAANSRTSFDQRPEFPADVRPERALLANGRALHLFEHGHIAVLCLIHTFSFRVMWSHEGWWRCSV